MRRASQRSGNGRRRDALRAAFASAVLGLAASQAGAAPDLFYHASGDTVPPGYAPSLPTGNPSVSVPLAFEPSPFTAGVACNTVSSGVCGIEFHLQVSPGLSVSGFSFNDVFLPDTGNRQQNVLLESCAPEVGDPASLCSTLRVNAVTAQNPVPEVGVLGTVFVDTSAPHASGLGRVTLLRDVEPSSLSLRNGAPRDLFVVPEPGRWALLASGVAGLSALHALRQRRRRW